MSAVIANGPPATWLADVAEVASPAVPVTSLVPSVSPFLNPLNVAVSGGLASPGTVRPSPLYLTLIVWLPRENTLVP